MSIFKTVESESEPGVEYLVSLDRFGKWRCDCMNYVMQVNRGEKKPRCKHIRKIILERKEMIYSYFVKKVARTPIFLE